MDTSDRYSKTDVQTDPVRGEMANEFGGAPFPRLADDEQRELLRLRRESVALTTQQQLLAGWVSTVKMGGGLLVIKVLLQHILQLWQELTGADQGSLFWLDETGAIAESLLARGATIREQKRDILGKILNAGLAGWVVEQRRIGLIEDTINDDRWITLPNEPYTTRSALCVPMIRGKRLLCVLTVMHELPNYFDPRRMDEWTAVAEATALVLDNAQLYVDLDHQRNPQRDPQRESQRESLRDPQPGDPAADQDDLADLESDPNGANTAPPTDATGLDLIGLTAASPVADPRRANALPLSNIRPVPPNRWPEDTPVDPHATLVDPRAFLETPDEVSLPRSPLTPTPPLDEPKPEHPTLPDTSSAPEPVGDRPLTSPLSLEDLGLYVTTADGKLRYVNRQFARLLGYSRREIAGIHSIVDLIAPGDRNTFAARMEACQNQGQTPLTGILHSQTKAGHPVPLVWHAERIHFSGRPGTIGVVYPVSDSP